MWTYLEFLSNKDIKEYEDDCIKAWRDSGGKVTIKGKPFKEVFIYGKPTKKISTKT